MSKQTLRIEPSSPVDVELRRGSPKIKRAKHGAASEQTTKTVAQANSGDIKVGIRETTTPDAKGAGAAGAGAAGAAGKAGAAGAAAGAGEDPNRDTIRIYIRDAKPPIFARILQASMRIICLVLLFAVCAIGIPKLFGVSEFNVETASMTPEYPVGTLVFVQPKDPSTIRPGEVVTVIMNENLDMLTHRVTQNDYTNKMIVTKGDANNTEDSPTLYENIVGVVVFSLPVVGEVVNYLTNTDPGRIVGIAILIAIIALTFLAEGICSLLTKQDAKTYDKNNKPIEVPNPFPKKKEKKKVLFKPPWKLRSNKKNPKKKKK